MRKKQFRDMVQPNQLAMKKFNTYANPILMLMVFFTIGTTSAFGQLKMKLGKYRQILYLDDAVPMGHEDVYALRTIVPLGSDSNLLRVNVLGSRTGNEFEITVSTSSGKVLLMKQDFFMNGSRCDPESELNPWIQSKKDLEKFLWAYFHIVIKPRRQFMKELKNPTREPLTIGALSY